MNRITEKRINLRVAYNLSSDSSRLCYTDWLEKKLAEVIIKNKELMKLIEKL